VFNSVVTDKDDKAKKKAQLESAAESGSLRHFTALHSVDRHNLVSVYV